MKTIPKVSVVSISYNQESYIEAALQSFVMQQTDFAFEVVIADDCSTDKTPNIIARYAHDHPDIFRPILRKKNVGIQDNIKDALQHARGKYIALCEGDDYWTDPTKLQRQADFLDAHPDYSLCFHPVTVFFQNKEEKDTVYPVLPEGHHFNLDELLRWNFIQTCSAMYRRQKYDDLPRDILPLDWYLHLYHAQFGKIGFIDRNMGAYRRHAGGIWWDSHENVDEIWRKNWHAHFSTFKELLKLYGDNKKHAAVLRAAMDNMFGTLVQIDKKYGDQLVQKLIQSFPEDVEVFVAASQGKLQEAEHALHESQSALRTQEHTVAELRQLIGQKDELVANQAKEIATIKASRVWKTRNRVASLTGKKVI